MIRVQINTDGNIEVIEEMIDQIRCSVNGALERTNARITRVEVHLSNISSRKRIQKSRRCTMQARFVGCKPIAVTHQSTTLKQSVDCAADRLSRLIEHSVDSTRCQKGQGIAPPVSEPELM